MNTIQGIKAELKRDQAEYPLAEQLQRYKTSIMVLKVGIDEMWKKYAQTANPLLKQKWLYEIKLAQRFIMAIEELIAELQSLGESETWQGAETRNAEGRNA